MSKRTLDERTRSMVNRRASGAAGKHRDRRDRRARTRGAQARRALRDQA